MNLTVAPISYHRSAGNASIFSLFAGAGYEGRFAEDGNLRFYLRFKRIFGIITQIFHMRMHDMHGGETHVK